MHWGSPYVTRWGGYQHNLVSFILSPSAMRRLLKNTSSSIHCPLSFSIPYNTDENFFSALVTSSDGGFHVRFHLIIELLGPIWNRIVHVNQNILPLRYPVALVSPYLETIREWFLTLGNSSSFFIGLWNLSELILLHAINMNVSLPWLLQIPLYKCT